MRPCSWRAAVCLVPALALLVAAVRVDAEPLKCASVVARASAAFVKARGKTLARCTRAVVAGTRVVPIP